VDFYSEITHLSLNEKKNKPWGWGDLVFFTGLLVIERLFGSTCVFFIFLHHKNTFLPLQSTKFKVVDQWLSWFFISFLIVKIFCCPRDQKNIRLLDKRFFCFPIIHVEWKYVFNLRKNKTKKTCIWGYFCTFTPIFCVITKVIGSILIFSRCLLKF